VTALAPSSRPFALRTARDPSLGGAPLCAGDDAHIRIDLRYVAREVSSALGARLVALILVGGYARGEGGCVEGPTGLRPYNDYDLVAVVRGRAASAHAPLHEVAARCSARVGVEVYLWPISDRLAAAPPPTLFWLDVALGGARVLVGSPGIIDGARGIQPRDVPLSETARLLGNRAVGLALSRLAPRFDGAAVRHVHKAVLAVGDAKLLVLDRYRGAVRQRLAELQRFATAPSVGAELVRRYAEAVAFRERPDRYARAPGPEASAWYASAVERIGAWHLELEALRAGTPTDPHGYATFPRPMFGELPDVGGARALAASLYAAARLSLPASPWVGHPRERLARVAVALAYGPRHGPTRDHAARLLGVDERATDAALREALVRLIPFGG